MTDVLTIIQVFLPAIMLLTFCCVGLYYGFKEIRETREDERDMLNNKLYHVPLSEDPRFIVAKGNKESAIRNTVTQGIFFFISIALLWFRISDYEMFASRSTFRLFIIPFAAALGEYNLAMQIKSLSKTRKNIKDKARKMLLAKQRADDLIKSDPERKKRFEEKITKDRKKSEEEIVSKRADSEKEIVENRKKSEDRIDKERREQ